MLSLGGVAATVANEELLLLRCQVRQLDIVCFPTFAYVERSRNMVEGSFAVGDYEAVIMVI